MFSEAELKELWDLIQAIKRHVERIEKENDSLTLYKDILFNGRLIGYKIGCPKCFIQYDIGININRDVIKCMDCGHEYLQTSNIRQIIYE